MVEPDATSPRPLARILATKLRELRARRGLTQEQVAGALEVHESAVSRWENGSRFPTGEDLLALSELFKVSIDTLFGKSEQCAPSGSVLLDQSLLDRLERAADTAAFDGAIADNHGQALWLPVPEGSVLLPIDEAMRRANRVADKHRDSAFVDRLFRPRR
ncbi:MAG: helix-turn-helix transcriptional regulator [Planctomycetota bacterium]